MSSAFRDNDEEVQSAFGQLMNNPHQDEGLSQERLSFDVEEGLLAYKKKYFRCQ